MKSKTFFVCNECGYESAKWLGKCPSCSSWNTFAEEKVISDKKNIIHASSDLTVKTFDEIQVEDKNRIHSGSKELDRVLGGGIVKGALVLFGGEPGIGKSTLLLQLCDKLSKDECVLYVTGEESDTQIKVRAERLGLKCDNLLICAETNAELIIEAIEKYSPKAVVIDSIQTMYLSDISSACGSVSQVRECTLSFMRVAKDKNITFFIVGHVTKDGSIAGPRVLEHMVDCVLYFEGERHQSYRIIRAVKNRYGSTNEVGVFEMTDKGLLDVENPSFMLLSGRPANASGSAIVCAGEGTRPILAEIQALVAPTSFSVPRRMADGVDLNRLNLMSAILEKRHGLPLSKYDIYINVTGGIRLTENASDLALALAIASSYYNKPLPEKTAFFGEVGLTGETRTVTQAQRRLNEIQKLGFSECVLPFDSLGSIEKSNIKLTAVKNLSEAFKLLIGEK